MTEATDLPDRFLRYVGQTSPFPNGLEVSRAEGCWITDHAGRRYLDFISGIAVVNVGHSHPRVIEAVCEQMSRYAHTMVYGEHVQQPQVELAEAIAAVAPPGLDAVYFLTTGSEANDAALKMAAKLTGRCKLLAFESAYHGDTLGALACLGCEDFRRPFGSLLNQVQFQRFGTWQALEAIDKETAAVLVEPVQGEAGIQLPPDGWLQALRDRCTESGTLLIFDEVQTGFGRLGHWFAACKYGVTPDIITMAKGMGMGMPLAGILAPRDRLFQFAASPPFSHITTFGGHPVSCAAGLAGMRAIAQEGLLENALREGDFLLAGLKQIAERFPNQIREVRGTGLMIGAEFYDSQLARNIIVGCKDAGLILESTLLAEQVIRFSPPLIVTRAECETALETFSKVLAAHSAPL